MHLGLAAASIVFAGPVWAQNASDLAGRWTLNNALTSGPREIGFGVDWVLPAAPGAAPSGGQSGGGGRRGGRGGGGSSGRSGGSEMYPLHPESEADARRLSQLTAEAREPSTHLVIVDTPSAVTMTNDRGKARTFHPDSRDEVLQLEDGVDVSANTKRDAGRLIVLYQVEEGRQLRYTYSRNATPAQLIVNIAFVGRGGGDEVKRVYEPSRPDEPMTAPAPTATGAGSGLVPATGSVTAAGAQQAPLNQGPDAELKGLTTLGVVVEGLSQQATACGLKQEALEAAVTKHLTDAGFKVPRNTDEDSYVYINVMTASLSNGYCVSRYDATITTHTTTTLSYQKAPVLVEVSLLHKGGIAGGAPAVHADGVVKGLLDYLDGFITRIRDANKPH